MFALNSSALTLVPSTSANVDQLDALDPNFALELLKLKSEIDAFVNAQDAAERAFCEGDSAYRDCLAIASQKVQALKHRIRGLAIDCGIQADFLKEYSSSCKHLALAEASPF